MRSLPHRLGSIALFACVVAFATPAVADDLQTAREQHRACQKLLDAGRPCAALRACREGLKARPLAALVELSATAQIACTDALERRRRASQCAEGMVRNKETGGNCCWPGQIWLEGRCVGLPESCPETFSIDPSTQSCKPSREPCPDDPDRVVVSEEGQCCWPGQGWSSLQNRCVGAPVCPDYHEASGEVCVLLDSDGDGIHDIKERLPACVVMSEDHDGYEDDDGCPDIDNDQDGVCDRATEANLIDIFGVSCVGHDLCDGEREDKDGFEDEDGCPDPDNDNDGLLDARDRCPIEPEDKDGFEDEDGCPEPGSAEPPSTDLRPWAWAATGTGGAAVVVAASLHIAAEVLRDDVRDADREGGNLTSITQVDAQRNERLANDLSFGALLSYSIGGTILTTGLALFFLNDYEDPEQAFAPGFHVTPDGAPFFSLSWSY